MAAGPRPLNFGVRPMHISLAKPVLPYSDPDLVEIGWNDCAVGPKYQDLYEGGYCDACLAPIGPRNSARLEVSKTPKSDICGFEQRVNQIHLVSDVVLAAFSVAEQAAVGPRGVSFQKKSSVRRNFHEVTGAPVISHVGVLGGKYLRLATWQCSSCGYRAFSCTHPSLTDTARASCFVARSDITFDIDQAFLARDALGRTRICMSFARFRRLVDDLPGVSLWPSRVFCLSDEEVDRCPRTPLLDDANR